MKRSVAWQRGDKGQASMELMILTIPIFVLIICAVAFGRWGNAKEVVDNAAQTAAEAVAVGGGVNAVPTAETAAAAVLSSHHLECVHPTPADFAWSISASVHPIVTVTVTCTTSLASVFQLWFPGARTITASASVPMQSLATSASPSNAP